MTKLRKEVWDTFYGFWGARKGVYAKLKDYVTLLPMNYLLKYQRYLKHTGVSSVGDKNVRSVINVELKKRKSRTLS